MQNYCPNNSNYTFREVVCVPCQNRPQPCFDRNPCENFYVRPCNSYDMPCHTPIPNPNRCENINLLLFGIIVGNFINR